MKLLFVLFFIVTGPLLEAHEETGPKGSSIEDALIVATYDIPGLVNHQGGERESGFFLYNFRKIFRKAQEKLGKKIKFSHFPPKRSLKKFLDNDVFALLPAFEWQVPKKGYIRSNPIGSKVDIIFFLKGKRPNQILAKKKYKIGVVRDYPYPPASLKKNKGNLVYFEDMLAGVKMLRAGRAQLLLGDSPTTFETFLRLGVNDVEFSEKLAASSSYAYLYVQDTPIGKAFIRLVNEEYRAKKLREKFFDHTFRIKKKYLKSKEAVKSTKKSK